MRVEDRAWYVARYSAAAGRRFDLRRLSAWPAAVSLDRAGGALVAAGLLFPLVLFASRGLTLSGLMEESTGYRYFYSLRILYGDGERPWLPQGQLVGLLHICLQALLTAIGFAPTQLFPRLDVFVYVAAALPHIVAAVVLIWVIRPMTSVWAKLAMIAGALLVAYDWQSGGGVQLVEPDYLSWSLPVALLAIVLFDRFVIRGVTIRGKDVLLIGVFAGACLAIKPTYVCFPVTIVAWMLLRSNVFHGRVLRELDLVGVTAAINPKAILRISLQLIGVVLVTSLTLIGITWAYYLGDLDATWSYFTKTAGYITAVSGPVWSVDEWLGVATFKDFPDVLALGVGMVAVCSLSLLSRPYRAGSLALLSGLLLTLDVAFRRYYIVTLVETNSYILFAITAWLRMAHPDLGLLTGRLGSRINTVGPPLAVLGMSAGVLLSIGRFYSVFEPAFEESNAVVRQFGTFVDQASGRTLFLIPDNLRSPRTVDGVIYKGGMNLETTAWGDSPFVESMFGNRMFVLAGAPSASQPIDLSGFENVVFTSLPRDGPGVAYVASIFGDMTSPFQCSLQWEAPALTATLRGDWGVERTIVHACIPERMASATVAEGWYVPHAGSLDRPPTVAGPHGEPLGLGAGDLAYAGDSQLLWRIRSDGTWQRVNGEPGAMVRLANAGPWSLDNYVFAGLRVHPSGDRWLPDGVVALPLNSNAYLSEGSEQQPIPGFWISPADVPVEVVRMQDDTGPFVRIRALATADSIAIVGSQPLPELNGVRVSLRAAIRAHHANYSALSMYDFGSSNGARVYVATADVADEWAALALNSDAVFTTTASSGDNFSVGVSGVQVGTWFDVRELGIFVAPGP